MKIITDNTGCYMVEVIDTDSHKPAWVKVWNPGEIPVWVVAHCLADYLTPAAGGKELLLEFRKRV